MDEPRTGGSMVYALSGIGLGVAFLALIQYAGYLRSRWEIGHTYVDLASLWKGEFQAGSFFRPPRLTFLMDRYPAELRCFYLFRGKSGHYTQLQASLGRRYLHAFILKPSLAEKDDYLVESVRPEIVHTLMNGPWRQELTTIEALGGQQEIEVRFDGEKLLIRKKRLLLSKQNLEVFKKSCTELIHHLETQLRASSEGSAYAQALVVETQP